MIKYKIQVDIFDGDVNKKMWRKKLTSKKNGINEGFVREICGIMKN